MIRECKICCNNTANPIITISEEGYCNVCDSYRKYFDSSLLKEEYDIVQKLLQESGGKCMVGISGGKDSTATLLTLLERNAQPLAFTFDIGYDPPTTYRRAKELAEILNVAYELINIRPYITTIEKTCYYQLVEAYNLPITSETKKQFNERYVQGRDHYSTKDDTILPYIRPCQLCRKIVIKAYYAEAKKRQVQLIFLGINEWAHLSAQGKYSAIRALQPVENEPPVYIIHLPYLLQRTLIQTQEVIRKINRSPPQGDELVEANHNSCLLAAATEQKFMDLMGFHPDTTRLSREVTVGFLLKSQAKEALENSSPHLYSLSDILTQAGIL